MLTSVLSGSCKVLAMAQRRDDDTDAHDACLRTMDRFCSICAGHKPDTPVAHLDECNSGVSVMQVVDCAADLHCNELVRVIKRSRGVQQAPTLCHPCHPPQH